MMSKEHRQNISKALKGRVFCQEHKENLRRATTRYWSTKTGSERKLSEEHKRKISKSSKGKIVSEETKQKMSSYWKGHRVLKQTREKISNTLKGNKPSDETIQKLININNSKERKQRQSQIMKDWWKSKTLKERKAFMYPIYSSNVKSSSIELSVRKVLDSLDIVYIPQYSIGWYHVDIFIPSKNLVIECDGDYWHNLPGAQEKDRQRDTYLKRKGYQVVRLWESDIKKDAKEALLKVVDLC